MDCDKLQNTEVGYHYPSGALTLNSGLYIYIYGLFDDKWKHMAQIKINNITVLNLKRLILIIPKVSSYINDNDNSDKYCLHSFCPPHEI